MNQNLRSKLPQSILGFLPFLIFFPQGLLYAGVVIYLVALVISGEYRVKYDNVRNHPLAIPVAVIFLITLVVAVTGDRTAPKFWSGFAHYQIYIFLLLFLAAGKGEWQRMARRMFVAGGMAAASCFYLRELGLLPEVELFSSYINYSGNNSIAIGIMMSLVSGILLSECVAERGLRQVLLRTALFSYVCFALLFYAQTRTGALVFFLLAGIVFLQLLVHSWKKAATFLIAITLVAAVAWQLSPSLRIRVVHTIAAVELAVSNVANAEKDIRVELYQVAAEIALERPILGHGIGQWLPLNRQRAYTDRAKAMTTPHNDYLLYAVEIGLVGLSAFLLTWVAQLWLAVRIGGQSGIWLLMVTIGLIVGGAFNAILRDSVFGMPFMVLLAIPLAGLQRGAMRSESVERQNRLAERLR